MNSPGIPLDVPRTLVAAVLPAALAVAGLLAGSFVSALAYRLPRGMSVLWGRSVCPSCGQPLGARDLVPLLSYVALKRRCRHCRSPIPFSYPAVEALCAGGFVAAWYASDDPGVWLSRALLLCLLVALAITDLRDRVLPNPLTLGGLAVGLVLAAAGWTLPMAGALTGAAVGGGTMLLIRVVSRGGMGLGDAKMLAMIGAFVGPWGAVGTLVWASLAGSAVGLALVATRRATRKTKVPFGPFLAIGTLLAEPTVPHWLRFVGLQ